MNDDIDLKAMFYDMAEKAIEESGVYPHICLAIQDDGELLCEALDLQYPQVLQHIIKLRLEDRVVELIFGVDRSTKPGQGTEFKDVLTCAYWKLGQKRISRLTDGTWEIGIINYQPPPTKIVREWDWANQFWRDQMLKEIRATEDKYEQLAISLSSVHANKTKDPKEGRPEDISSEELAEWIEGFNHWCEGQDPPPIDSPESHNFYLEMYISSQWLERELRKLGADDNMVESQQAVCGQRTFLRTIWGAAKIVLENYKNGTIESPGPDLAQKIMLEQIGGGRMRIEGKNVIFRMGE